MKSSAGKILDLFGRKNKQFIEVIPPLTNMSSELSHNLVGRRRSHLLIIVIFLLLFSFATNKV